MTQAEVIALLAAPPAIGGTTPASGQFTTLTATGAISGTTQLLTSQIQVNSNSGIKFWANNNTLQSAIAVIGSTSTFAPYGAGGTMANSGGALGLGLHISILTFANASANTGGTAVAVFNGTYDTGAQGGMAGTTSGVSVVATPSDSTGREFVGGRDTSGVSSGVVGGAQQHAIIGRTTVAVLNTNATGWAELTGQEIAMYAATGSTVTKKHNLYLMRYSNDVVRATTDDIMFGMWNQYAQGATTGVKVGIDIGPGAKSGLYFPVGQDGTVIKASKGSSDSALTVANGIDFSAIATITENSLVFPNFIVTGAGAQFKAQPTPTALTTSATLTGAQILTGLLTANQGGGAAASYTLPTATNFQTACPILLANDGSFDFTLVNISTNVLETATILTNTGWTLVGDMQVQANSAVTSISSGQFRARRTASNTFTLYRIT
jgi:hypothetical protein